MATQPGLGVTGGDSLKSETTRLLDVVDNQVVFNDKVRIPIRPMIGGYRCSSRKGTSTLWYSRGTWRKYGLC